MNIAIIGGGLTGLSAGYELSKQGYQITIFEKDNILGGLAHGFQEKNWDWPLEFAYHHFFTNDNILINLLHELGMTDDIIIKRPVTATYIKEESRIQNLVSRKNNNLIVPKFQIPDSRFRNNIYQLDSPLSLLQFNQVPLIDRLRTGAMLALMKINPVWRPLEKYTAGEVFQKMGGQNMWGLIWEPLMRGKFGKFKDEVAASWLWARIKKRTTNLGYIQGGFQALINKLEDRIIKQGGQIHTNCQINKIESRILNQEFRNNNHKLPDSRFQILNSNFDTILITTPTPIAQKLISSISFVNHKSSIVNRYFEIPHLHAQMLILETTEPILEKVYWLNITDKSFPFLALVAHTNFIDKKNYGGNHITYIGNYLPDGHPYLQKNADQLLSIFKPYIAKIAPNRKLKIENFKLFVGLFAQPVHRINYSQIAPKLETGIPGVYLANMDSIYPWDRGTNYAIELGQKSAAIINKQVI